MQLRRRRTMLALAQLATMAWPARSFALDKIGKSLSAPGQAELWSAYARGLATQLNLDLSRDTFKIGSGLAVADWEVINYTGLPKTSISGTKIWQNAYNWGDTMPQFATPSYLPGNSWYSQYAAFVNALTGSVQDQPALDNARAKLSLDKMADDDGGEWPAYHITPGLNDFLIASLQSLISKPPPQIQFCLALPDLPADVLFNATAPQQATASCHATPFFGIANCTDAAPVAAQKTAPLKPCSGATHVEFKAQSAQMFRVQPGRWYDSSLISNYNDHINQDSALANKPLFGPNGALNLRTTQILVGTGRSVILHLGAEQLDRCAAIATSTRAAVLNIGGFCFHSACTDISTGSGTLIFRDNTNAPFVIGVTAQVFGNALQQNPV